MAEQRDKIRELESKLESLQHSEFATYLKELLKLEFQKNAMLLIEKDDPIMRGALQHIKRQLKILGVAPLIFE